jgi:protein kinase N
MSSQKLELLKMSLENRLTEFPHLVDSSDTAEVSIPRPAQLTGTLTLKLLGCEGLVDITHLRSIISVPISFNHRPSTGNLLHMMTLPRTHRANSYSSSRAAGDLETEKEGFSPPGVYNSSTLANRSARGSKSKKNFNKQASSQDLLDDYIFGEICAILSMDNREVGRTKWSSPGNKAWEQQFKIELDRNRELEICINYRDRECESLCGVLYIRLQDVFNTPSSIMCLPMEPQGILLAELSYQDPKTELRQPKLKRNRKLFIGKR